MLSIHSCNALCYLTKQTVFVDLHVYICNTKKKPECLFQSIKDINSRKGRTNSIELDNIHYNFTTKLMNRD